MDEADSCNPKHGQDPVAQPLGAHRRRDPLRREVIRSGHFLSRRGDPAAHHCVRDCGLRPSARVSKDRTWRERLELRYSTSTEQMRSGKLLINSGLGVAVRPSVESPPRYGTGAPTVGPARASRVIVRSLPFNDVNRTMGAHSTTDARSVRTLRIRRSSWPQVPYKADTRRRISEDRCGACRRRAPRPANRTRPSPKGPQQSAPCPAARRRTTAPGGEAWNLRAFLAAVRPRISPSGTALPSNALGRRSVASQIPRTESSQ